MRYACQSVIFLLIIASVGCALCGESFDDHYAAYGGLHDRLDRVDGRVGSVFAPASATALDMLLSESEENATLGDSPTAESVVPDVETETDGVGPPETDTDADLSDDLQDALRDLQESLPDTPNLYDET